MAVWPTVEALIVSDRSPEGVEAQMREAETAGVKYMITHSSPEALGSALAVQVELVHRAQVRQNLTPCAGGGGGGGGRAAAPPPPPPPPPPPRPIPRAAVHDQGPLAGQT
ncbi:hypothetical protein Aros01_01945 [Streptosporangium roseum]